MAVTERKMFGHDLQTVFFATGYCVTSSLLSIINKFAVKVFPYPSSLTGLQYATSAAAVYVFGVLGLIDKVEPFTWATVTSMTPVVITFCGSVFCNMKVLQHANVETFIVLRSTTPLVVAVVDAVFRPYAAIFPSFKTWCSLILILIGAAGYVYVDSEFKVDSYLWGAAYIFFFVVEMVWVKDIMTKVKISNWGLVFYNNFGSLFISLILALWTNEGKAATWLFGLGAFHTTATADVPALLASSGPGRIRRFLFDATIRAANATAALASAAGDKPLETKFLPVIQPDNMMSAEADELWVQEKLIPFTAVTISCLFGLGISFFGFAIRRKISATGFTVMGCTNKLITLLVNTLVWSLHASMPAQGCVLISIAGGVMYSEFSKADAEERKSIGVKEVGVPISTKPGAGTEHRGGEKSV